MQGNEVQAVSKEMNAELIWFRQHGAVTPAVYVGNRRPPFKGAWPASAKFAHVDGRWPILQSLPEGIVYRAPTRLAMSGKDVHIVGEVYAILAGEGKDGFAGARLNFRDVIEAGRKAGVFVYVVPTTGVRLHAQWQGYVRLGYRRWIALPVPRPQAVYNRIPTRALEGRASTVRARQTLAELAIPMYNPSYFHKSHIYDMIRRHGLDGNLPDTRGRLTRDALVAMCRRHQAVYLKPAGGSVGHGMMRIDTMPHGYTVAVLKDGRTAHFTAAGDDELWRIVQREKVRGQYVLQEAIRLLEVDEKPCDFRVLLQKSADTWRVVGYGVRVSGKGRITTHVPNGGSIANAKTVLRQAFGGDAPQVEAELEAFVLRAAQAIDTEYGGRLGEMSMDIGIDPTGKPWFFEANAKPMKFDEPQIRSASLTGVIDRLRYLAGHN
ncbi:hypothetical protein URH17368_2341 [Alicyclobacillus hesperidum URH17-3-68]|nr:hypothetical protein URH17368_2341 [Alicyclobacillus hesperidum URH17-3-68]